MRDLIAKTPEEYLEIAMALARDLDRLKNIRQTLRDRVRGSALMDAVGFTRDLESAYRRMWYEWYATGK
jgi:predicted O-linked N-acetylglucosamine transferase (SPINDLY family)